MSHLYSLYTLSKTPGYPLNTWYEEYKIKYLCPGCHQIKPDIVGPIDGYLDSAAYNKAFPDNAPINFIIGARLGYARRDFLELFGSEIIFSCLDLGKLLDENGKELDDYVTFRGKDKIWIRAKEDSEFAICPVCGQVSYIALGTTRYVVRSDLKQTLIHVSQKNSLVVEEQFYERFQNYQRKKLGIWKLPVRDSPIDGKPF
jgi:hypothetical protein